MPPMSVTELVSHAEMSALNAVASAKHGPHVRHRPGVPRVHVTRLTCLVNIGQAVIDSSLEVISVRECFCLTDERADDQKYQIGHRF